MRVYLRIAMLGTLGLSLGGCVTQLVTTPTQVAAQTASQTTQTAAQTAGQAAQVAIPDGDEKKGQTSSSQSSARSTALSGAGFLRTEAEAVSDYRLDTSSDNKDADVKKSSRSDRQ